MPSTTATLTSRQRVIRALERRDHDRIPRHDDYWPDTIADWNRQGLQGDRETVESRYLLCDFRGVVWSWPIPFPGRREVVAEDDETVTFIGTMGEIRRVFKARTSTPEHVGFCCKDRATWENEYKPALLANNPRLDLAGARVNHDYAQKHQRFAVLRGVESFEAMRQLVGDEVLLMAMALEPEWVLDMSRTYTDLILQSYQTYLDAGLVADAVWVYGDIAYNPSPFFSLPMYHELIAPDHRRICDWAHAHGMKFLYHSDGNIQSFIPTFVEIGYDAVQPLEAKAGMDVRKLAPLYGDRLSFFGNIDMTVALTNDRDRIEHEMRTKLAAGMANRGYLYHSDHSVPPGVSWATYRWMLELLDRYGRYE